MGGQSNAGGHANGTTLPVSLKTQPSIPYFYTVATTGNPSTYTTLTYGGYSSANTYGPEITFGYDLNNWMQSVAPGDKIAIIKYAVGATSLYTNWKAGGTSSTTGDGSIYKTFQTTVTAGLAAFNSDSSLAGYTKSIDGMLWVQGEEDINLQAGVSGAAVPSATNYASNLTTLITDVRATFGSNIPFYFSEISLNQTNYSSTPALTSARDTLRSAQVSVAGSVAGAYLINTDAPGFSVFGDKIHYNEGGEQTLGSAFASRVIQVAAVPEPRATALMILSGLVLIVTSRIRTARSSER